MTHTVVIADDHGIFRRGLVDILGDQTHYRVIAEAGDGIEALALCETRQPDLLILDLNMPGLDGFGVLRRLADRAPSPIVAMLTIYNDELYLARATSLGARGYLLKENAEVELLTCLDRIAAGGLYTTPALLGLPDAEHLIRGLDTLSPAESRVLAHLATLGTNTALAEELGLSLRTVENHRAHIVEKLGLNGANALLRFALEYRGLIS